MLNDLRELRARVLALGLFFVCVFLLCFYFSQTLLAVVLHPFVSMLTLPDDGLIATRITAPLFTPIQLAFDVALFVTVPFILLSSWRFISPGLYRHERVAFASVLFGSFVLFILGVGFCFYVVLPNVFYLIIHARPIGVRLMPDLTETVQWIGYFLLLFGVCFQLPLVCVVLVYTKLLTLTTLKQIRPYVIVAAFIIGMLLTPPDVLSQIMLAVPLCVLYELGIVLSHWTFTTLKN